MTGLGLLHGVDCKRANGVNAELILGSVPMWGVLATGALVDRSNFRSHGIRLGAGAAPQAVVEFALFYKHLKPAGRSRATTSTVCDRWPPARRRGFEKMQDLRNAREMTYQDAKLQRVRFRPGRTAHAWRTDLVSRVSW